MMHRIDWRSFFTVVYDSQMLSYLCCIVQCWFERCNSTKLDDDQRDQGAEIKKIPKNQTVLHCVGF